MNDMRSNGIVIGLVSDLDDPLSLGRVKVKYPHLEDQESDWARLATPMAGPKRGTFFRPEVEDEVLVGFEHGDPRRPYILGSLWSQVDQPPPDDGQKEQNNWRFIQSRSGHIFKLDDTQGKEKIEILSKGGHQVRLDDTPGSQKIEIIANGGQKVVIDTTGDQIQILCSTGQVKVEALNVDVKATGSVNLEATGTMSLKAASMSVEATGNLTLKGGVVMIN
jgi:uncharacterized protein involved in type VI secretion and phage assembly